jgi:hypothetical protein
MEAPMKISAKIWNQKPQFSMPENPENDDQSDHELLTRLQQLNGI